MEQVWQVITGAPWWIYILFLYLVMTGVISTQKGRQVPVKRIMAVPIVFLAWAISDLYGIFTLAFFLCGILFLAFGALFGAWEAKTWRIEVHRRKHWVALPPNYSTFILIVLIFVLKFIWAYFYATRTPAPQWVYYCDIISTSWITGFFVGRAGMILRRYLQKSD